ncbi:MAG: lipid-A-disaccharide synthase [Planctomycetota bacterium]|jgi:lipid-A-disaccharide synthase
MQEVQKKYRVFLSAAEASGDGHCAGLAKSLKKTGCDIEFVGVGGPKMAAAGCEMLEETTGRAAMLYNAFAHIVHYYKLINRISNYLKNNKADLVIVCDSPAFNFHIAKAAKKNNIKTLFYVAPQLWAWAPWRIRKLRKCCDKLCCLLPFEQEWFRQRGVDTTFVGNPLLDGISFEPESAVKNYIQFEAGRAKIAIMPGSREAEIDTLWGPMQQIALRLKQKFPNVEFTTVAVDEKRKAELAARQIGGFECNYSISSVIETARASDLAIVASGSATVQVAGAGCPMVIMYQSNRMLWHLVGRWLITAKHLSLVNILAQKELVPEFMPYFKSIEPTSISGELISLTKPLRISNASQKTAEIATQMLDEI